MTPVVKEHNRVVAGQRLDVIRKVFLHTDESVDDQQAGARTADLHREVDAVIHSYEHVSIVHASRP